MMGFYIRGIRPTGREKLEGKIDASVAQDKKPPGRLIAASVQPATADDVAVDRTVQENPSITKPERMQLKSF